MKRLLALGAILMLVAGCTTLSTQPTTATVRLRCSPVGDNGSAGCASAYDLRWSYDSTAIANILNWANQTQVTGEPVPRCPSPTAKDTFVVAGLPSDTTLFFCLRVGDEKLNWSALSNVRRVQTPDNIAPGPVTDLEGVI